MKLKNLVLLIFVFFIALPVFANNHLPNSQTNNSNPGSQTNNSNPGISRDLQNPLGNINSIPELVQSILDIVLTIGVPIIVIAIIYSGFKFIAAQGNPEKLKEAKQTLLYVLIGAAILLAAYAIAQAIVSTVTAIRE